MLDNLLFTMARVFPFFLLILLGAILVNLKVLSRDFLNGCNKFVYKIALPVNLFLSAASIDWSVEVSGSFLLFCLIATLANFAVIWAVTELLWRKKRSMISCLVQGGFRGNYALLGVPLAVAVLGDAAIAPATVTAAIIIPAYNALSVVVMLARGKDTEGANVKKLVKGIVTNPLIIGIALGLCVSALGWKLPYVLDTTAGYISATATPLGLLSIGGIFNLKAATARLKPTLYASAIKLLIAPAVMVTIAYLLGFRSAELLVVFIAFGAPVAVSSYPMAVQLGADAPLAANILIVTTFFSAFTLAGGIWLLRGLGLI